VGVTLGKYSYSTVIENNVVRENYINSFYGGLYGESFEGNDCVWNKT
jgi:hypothetical protein